MRKIASFLLLVALGLGVCHGQNVEVGILTSGNAANLNGDKKEVGEALAGTEGTYDFETRTGWRIEFLTKVGLTESFAVRPGIAIAEKGTNLQVSSATFVTPGGTVSADGVVNTDYTYIEVPVLAEYTFLAGNRFSPYITGGPWAAFTTGSYETIKVTRENSSGESAEVINRSEDVEISGTDFGATAGGGLEYTVDDDSYIFVEVQYSRGFSDTQDEGSIELTTEAITYGIGFSASI